MSHDWQLTTLSSYMSRFEQRLNFLEDTVRRHDGLLQNTEAAPIHRDEGGQPRHNTASSSESSRHVRFGNEISLDAAELQELPPEEALTDGMAVTFVNEEDTAFFGVCTQLKTQSVANQIRSVFQHRVHASHCTCNDANWERSRCTHSRIER